MMNTRPAQAATAALLIAPLLGLAGLFLLPAMPTDPAGQLIVIAENPGRWLVANLVLIASQLLLVPAMLLLARLLQSSRSRAGTLGAVLMVASAVLHVGVLGYVTAQLPMAEAAATAAVDRMFGTAFTALIVPTLATAYLGIILVSIGIWRTRLAPRWVPVALLVGTIMDLIEPIGAYGMFTLWALGFGAIVWRARRQRPHTGEPVLARRSDYRTVQG
jgi:hypothetical protein